MKNILMILMNISLIASPVAIINTTVNKEDTKDVTNIHVNLGDWGNIHSGADISLGWTSSSSEETSQKADLIDISNYAIDLNDFIKKYPTVQLSFNGDDYTAKNEVWTTNPIYPVTHTDGSYKKSLSLNTADLFKQSGSVGSEINKYDLSDASDGITATSSIYTSIRQTGEDNFLTMETYSYVVGHAGPFSKWENASSGTQISDVEFIVAK